MQECKQHTAGAPNTLLNHNCSQSVSSIPERGNPRHSGVHEENPSGTISTQPPSWGTVHKKLLLHWPSVQQGLLRRTFCQNESHWSDLSISPLWFKSRDQGYCPFLWQSHTYFQKWRFSLHEVDPVKRHAHVFLLKTSHTYTHLHTCFKHNARGFVNTLVRHCFSQ